MVLDGWKMNSGIYYIKNILNNKVYVGSSVDIYARWRCHKYMLKNNKHTSKHLQHSWNKYGEKSFEFIVIEFCDVNLLIENEQKHIDNLKSYNDEFGYNLNRYAGTTLGYKHTEASKRLISEAGKRRKGIKFSEEHKKKISEVQQGKSYIQRMGEETAERVIKEKSKPYNEKYGFDYANEIRNSISYKTTQSWLDIEIREKRCYGMIGAFQSENKKEKCRISKLGNLNPMYKNVDVNIMKKVCEYYEKYGKVGRKFCSSLDISVYLFNRILKENNLK